ncbi:MAG TPA: hypothetical protein VLR94_09820, partial [Acidobacteriota bacterium]|nr:hypothetical protein [Acidobacteriota bacterium]
FWDKGNYQVIEGPLPKEIVSLNMTVPQIILDGILKSRDRHWVLQHIGSPESVFQPDTGFHEKNAVYKLPVEETVSRMNGKRSLNEIAQATGQDAFEVCKAVAALKILGMVQRVPEKAAPVPLMVAEAAIHQEATITEIAPVAHKQDLSLGQVLQIPTVEELQQEQEAEEREPTLIVAPKEPPPAPPIPKPVVEPPVPVFLIPEPVIEPRATEPATAAMRPKFPAEEEEDTEAILERITAPKPAVTQRPVPEPPQPTRRVQPPSFGKAEVHAAPVESPTRRRTAREDPYVRTWNWKKSALATGLIAALLTAVTYVYTQYPQKPPAREYPEMSPPKPLGSPAGKAEPKHQEPVTVPTPSQQATPQVPKVKVPPPAPAPAPVQKAQQAPQAAKPTPASAAAPSTPLGLAKSGKLADAANAWRKSLLPKKSQYTIQLEIACQDDTVLEAFQMLNDSPQVSVVPLDYKGKACYRVLYGVYLSTAEAETNRARLPQEFLKQQSPAQVIPLAKALK